MNIKCNYCGSEFDETLEKCPNCGASNANIKRSVIDQPTTIEELKDWYQSKGLPPYETTRFFIGIDYKNPRAFGIYKDMYTGNFVVYKNKDNGQRAVRYEGTDEAYAVNELFMRLKQEILEQKSRNIDSRKASYQAAEEKKAIEEEKDEAYKTFIQKDTKEEAARQEYLRLKGEAEYERKRNITIAAGVIVAVIICIIFGIGSFKAYVNSLTINPGYYKYNDEVYYHRNTYEDSGWFKYDPVENDWHKEYVVGLPLTDKLKSQNLFVTEDDYSALGCSDACDSIDYKIEIYGSSITKGYYKVGEDYYFHQDDDNTLGWFKYDRQKKDWVYSVFYNLPEELKEQFTAQAYFYETDGEQLPFKDIMKSEVFITMYPKESASYPEEDKGEGYFEKDGKIYYHNDSDDPEDWYEYDSGTAKWNRTYQVPEDVESNESSYFGAKDFTQTEYYTKTHPVTDYSYSSDSNYNKTSSDSWWDSSDDDSWSSSDSSWNWSSSDSWDSGSTDWGSDW